MKFRTEHKTGRGGKAVCLAAVLLAAVMCCGCGALWRLAGLGGPASGWESSENSAAPQTEQVTEETGTETGAETNPEAAGEEILPARYDYREQGRCPAAGSQGELGTCWAFATMLAMESSLLPEESYDFSEDHISLHNSFGMPQDMGGDYTMAMAYLLAWQGPVLEEQDPYGDGVSPDGLAPVRHVQEIRILDDKDYDAIKRTVYDCGGVQTSLYIAQEDAENGDLYYRPDTYAYYYNGEKRSNHDVVIIGWDDAYPRGNFNMDPGMDGAFLCMNSWGTEFGDAGLFYVSYGDINIGKHSLAYTGIEAPDNYTSIYQTDLCGWLGQLGYGDEEAYFANVYTAEGDERLDAVGFYATGPGTEYEIYVIRGVGEEGRFRLESPVASGSFRYSGYYTVPLETPEMLNEGERFAVAVHIRTPGAVHPVAIEYQSSESTFSAQVDISDGEGYISADGRNWSGTEEAQNSNVCLKAYTSAGQQ